MSSIKLSHFVVRRGGSNLSMGGKLMYKCGGVFFRVGKNDEKLGCNGLQWEDF